VLARERGIGPARGRATEPGKPTDEPRNRVAQRNDATTKLGTSSISDLRYTDEARNLLHGRRPVHDEARNLVHHRPPVHRRSSEPRASSTSGTPTKLGTTLLSVTHAPESLGTTLLSVTHAPESLGTTPLSVTHAPESLGTTLLSVTDAPESLGTTLLRVIHAPESFGTTRLDVTHAPTRHDHARAPRRVHRNAT
jgi:hypothetical protein